MIRAKLGVYAKGVAAIATAGLMAAQAALVDGWQHPGDDITVGLAVLGAIAIWRIPNKPAPADSAE